MKDPKLKIFMFLIIHCILQTLAKGFKMEGYYILQTTSSGLTWDDYLILLKNLRTLYKIYSRQHLFFISHNMKKSGQPNIHNKTNVLLLVKVIKPVYFKNVLHIINYEHHSIKDVYTKCASIDIFILYSRHHQLQLHSVLHYHNFFPPCRPYLVQVRLCHYLIFYSFSISSPSSTSALD